MKVRTIILAASAIGILGAASLLTPTAFAWHPKGVITKQVQNITSGGALSSADNSGSPVATQPGDTIQYTITVSNTGTPASNGDDDMANTVMTDSLPNGVTLVSNPAERQIKEDLGTIQPGKSVVKTYLATITATTAGTIENTACFTGNSKVNDNPQQGCSSAFVSVTIPQTPVTPVAPVTPTQPTPPQLPAELPHTGMAENIIATSLALGLIVYTVYLYAVSRRELQATK